MATSLLRYYPELIGQSFKLDEYCRNENTSNYKIVTEPYTIIDVFPHHILCEYESNGNVLRESFSVGDCVTRGIFNKLKVRYV